jgi:hypothetical protein
MFEERPFHTIKFKTDFRGHFVDIADALEQFEAISLVSITRRAEVGSAIL